MNRTTLNCLILAFVLALLARPEAVLAGPISSGAFGPNATTTDFDALGLGLKPASPQVIDGHTFSTGNGFIRYQTIGVTSPASATGEQLATDADLDTLSIELDSPKQKAGLLVNGIFSDGWEIRVEFLDSSDSVLGFQDIAGAGLGMLFSGWESTGNDIAKINVIDNRRDFRIIAIDNLTLEAIPEPTSGICFFVGALALPFLRQSTRGSIRHSRR